MNRNAIIIVKFWKQLKGTMRENWGKLTDDEVDEMGGRKDHFLGKVQEKYGATHWHWFLRIINAHDFGFY
ncbi:CsbD family protein [Marinobacter sp. ELB17]|uniref:CsbD family protein n=1 Tax=Marinobacter sp. ELB17 TaxID=270374 RepID=UPI0029CAB9D7|nr:CsbD family protein [Marinobacter sp. ELB17]